MSELTVWLRLLFSHWQNWVSGGGVGGIVVVIVYIVERILGWTMHRLWYFLLFIVLFILGSSFMVWRDEYQNVLKLEAERITKFTGKITFVATGAVGKENKDTVLIMEVTITNTGAQSVADDFTVLVRLEGKEVKGLAISPTSNEINIYRETENGREEMNLKPEDYLPRKCMLQPIAAGGGVNGFVMEYIPDVSKKQFDSGAVSVSLAFKDIFGKVYTAQAASSIFSQKIPTIFTDPNKLGVRY